MNKNSQNNNAVKFVIGDAPGATDTESGLSNPMTLSEPFGGVVKAVEIPGGKGIASDRSPGVMAEGDFGYLNQNPKNENVFVANELLNVESGKRVTAAERSASFQGVHPYEGIDPLRNIELLQGKVIAHVTFRADGRPVSEYFTTQSAVQRSTLSDGSIDANRLNQGLQIYPGTDPLTGLMRTDFKPFVQFFEINESIPMGEVAFGRALANPNLNPEKYPALPQLFINKEYHDFLIPLEIKPVVNTPSPAYTSPKGN